MCCGKPGRKLEKVDLITSPGLQDSVFNGLVATTNFGIPEDKLADSLTFLLLPMHASCPACRNKTIDSILRHQNNLLDRHYIIISANGGLKTINSYFKERKGKLPTIPHRLFLDSTAQASKNNLYDDNPLIYYTYNKKAYKKITAIPITVKEDLREFFSGYRLKKKNSNAMMQRFKIDLQVDYPGKSDRYYSLRLKQALSNEPVEYSLPKRIFVIADIEGPFQFFCTQLLKRKIVNKYLQWTFGEGHLVIIGDCFF